MAEPNRGIVVNKPILVINDQPTKGMTRDSSTVFRKALFEKMAKNKHNSVSSSEDDG